MKTEQKNTGSFSGSRAARPETWDNYEYTKEKIRPEFLKYDQGTMIRRFRLKHDGDYLYLPFVGSEYRIRRQTGEVEKLTGQGDSVRTEPADYSEALSIYDILCYSRSDATLSGRWSLVNSLPGVGQNSGLGDNSLNHHAQYVDQHPDAYKPACEAIGGKEVPCGDIGYEIPVYPFYPIRLRFYHSDEEFPAQMSVLFDENTLNYMHYETTFYVVGCLMRAIRSRMQERIPHKL